MAQCDNYPHRLTLENCLLALGDIATSNTLEGPYKKETEMQKQNCFPESLCSLQKTKESENWDIMGTKNEKTLYVNWSMI